MSKMGAILRAMDKLERGEVQPFIPAVQHPANQDRRAFLVDRGDGVMVEDASAACAGVHDNGFETEAEFIAWWMGEGKE